MALWWHYSWLICRCPIVKWSHCNSCHCSSCHDRLPVDEIIWYLIFKLVVLPYSIDLVMLFFPIAVTWQGWESIGIVDIENGRHVPCVIVTTLHDRISRHILPHTQFGHNAFKYLPGISFVNRDSLNQPREQGMHKQLHLCKVVGCNCPPMFNFNAG